MATKAIKVCAVNFVKGFFDRLVPTNKVIEHFQQRPFKQQLALVTGRLVDRHEEMLNKWRENGQPISALPIFLMGFDKSYASSGLEKGRSITASDFIVYDQYHNFFKLRLSKHDQRIQIVLYAPDHESAFSFADQFKLYCADYRNRHHFAVTEYHGIPYQFAMTLEDNNIFGANSQIADQDNLTVLAFDLTFTCHTPYFCGDDVTKEPYLPKVKAVVLDHAAYANQLFHYHQVISDGQLSEEALQRLDDVMLEPVEVGQSAAFSLFNSVNININSK